MDAVALAGIVLWVSIFAFLGCFIAAIVIGTRVKKDEKAREADKSMMVNLGIAAVLCGIVFLLLYFGVILPRTDTFRIM